VLKGDVEPGTALIVETVSRSR